MSEILVDTLTGKTSAGNITVTSEGGAATMQLQQGLAKSWIDMDSAAAVDDSLNVSSTSDNGTGDRSVTISNAMSNSNYGTYGNGITTSNSSGSNCHVVPLEQDKSTTVQRFLVVDDRSTSSPPGRENSAASFMIMGDLA